jgi:hypothetical protein
MAGVTAIVGSLRSGLTAAVGTQLVLTLASLGYATGHLGTASNNRSLLLENKANAEEVFDAHHYDFVTEFVTGIYAGRGASTSSSHPHVKLADTVTFEDPAARCYGPHEVQEAFRALKYLEPRSVRPPYCVDVEPQGESIALSYALHQQYYFGGRLELQSLLVVNVQLRQRKDVPESEFLVLQMEEHWNGIPFWNSYLFRIVRRINGMVSWQLTKRIL